MSSLSGEQAVASQRARIQTLSNVWTKAFGCIEKLTDLNLRAAKSTLAENQAIASAALSTKDPQALFALHAKRAQAAMEEAQSYWRHVWNIVVSTQAELVTSGEAQFNKRLRDTQAFVDTAASNAPAGTEAVNALQTAVTAASEATSATIEASKKAAEQAREIAESSIDAAASASNRATRQAAEQVKAATKK